MSEFKVGEIAIFIGRTRRVPYGTEVEIVSEKYIFTDHRGSVVGYDFIFHGMKCAAPNSRFGEFFTITENLKKKPKKRDIDQLVSWSDCLWKPQGVNA